MKSPGTVPKNDYELIERYKQGEKDVTGILYKKYFTKVFHKCLSFVKDESEANDLTQDILIKAIENLDKFKGTALFSTWLYSITINHCIEYMKKKNQYKKVEIEHAMLLPEEDRSKNEYLEGFIDTTLKSLSQQEKELLELKYNQGLSIKELQEKLNLSASAIKMRLKRAKTKAAKSYNLYLSKIAYL
ncbi:MAG: RNA polymerase sigma factor [Bacteroidota bacterium]